MSYYVGIALLVFVALIEVSVLPLFRVYGLQPNLTLIVLLLWLMVRGAEEAFVLVPIGAIVLGLVEGAPLGTALVALAPLAILNEVRGSQLRESGLVLSIGFIIVMSLFYNFTYLAVFTLQGQGGDWLTATTRIIVPAALVNVAVLLPLYLLFTIVNPQPRRSLYA
jgi:cell shape-determining protein MreD